MDTNQTDFDFTEELWRFVRARFSSQAKQLQKVAGRPLSQAFELVAQAHGFTDWRGLSKSIDALTAIDSIKIEDDKVPSLTGNPVVERAARLAMALAEGFDEILADKTMVDWQCFERAIGRPPTLAGYSEFDIAYAVRRLGAFRMSLFYKIAWVGKKAPWSDCLLNEFYNCQLRLEDEWGKDDPRAAKAVEAMFGRGHCDQGFQWEFSSFSHADYNEQVDQILASKKISSEGPFKAIEAAYRHSIYPSRLIRVHDLREMMAGVDPGAMDGFSDESFLLALLLFNAPADCLVSTQVLRVREARPEFDLVHMLGGGEEAFAPTREKAAQLAACLPSRPKFAACTEEDFRECGLPADSEWFSVTAS